MSILNVVPWKYGISERKKAELDALKIDVINAQYEVDQFQAIVDALTAKLSQFNGFLAIATTDKETALKNKNLFDAALHDAKSLLSNSNIAFDAMVEAEYKIGMVGAGMKEVIDKLIFSVEIINRLQKLIVSKKALNPIISDELVKMVTQASTDANTAIADCLVALETCYASTTTGNDSEYSSSVEVEHAQALVQCLTGASANKLPTVTSYVDGHEVFNDTSVPDSLQTLINKAYQDALTNYDFALKADEETAAELDVAQYNLDKATVKFNALNRAYAAAEAAALA